MTLEEELTAYINERREDGDLGRRGDPGAYEPVESYVFLDIIDCLAARIAVLETKLAALGT